MHLNLRIVKQQLEISRVIAAPAPVVWHLLIDTRTWSTWGPSVQEVSVNAGADVIGFASRGKVRIWGKMWVPFEVTHFVPERYWAWKVGGIAATGHRLEMIDAGTCRLTFEVPIWAAPYAVVCSWAIKRVKQVVQIRPPDTLYVQ